MYTILFRMKSPEPTYALIFLYNLNLNPGPSVAERLNFTPQGSILNGPRKFRWELAIPLVRDWCGWAGQEKGDQNPAKIPIGCVRPI